MVVVSDAVDLAVVAAIVGAATSLSATNNVFLLTSPNHKTLQ